MFTEFSATHFHVNAKVVGASVLQVIYIWLDHVPNLQVSGWCIFPPTHFTEYMYSTSIISTLCLDKYEVSLCTVEEQHLTYSLFSEFKEVTLFLSTSQKLSIVSFPFQALSLLDFVF